MSRHAECGSRVRGGGTCSLSEGHRGYHSRVTFQCDGCSKVRRGLPTTFGFNPWDGEVEAAFCFLCSDPNPLRTYMREGVR